MEHRKKAKLISIIIVTLFLIENLRSQVLQNYNISSISESRISNVINFNDSLLLLVSMQGEFIYWSSKVNKVIKYVAHNDYVPLKVKYDSRLEFIICLMFNKSRDEYEIVLLDTSINVKRVFPQRKVIYDILEKDDEIYVTDIEGGLIVINLLTGKQTQIWAKKKKAKNCFIVNLKDSNICFISNRGEMFVYNVNRKKITDRKGLGDFVSGVENGVNYIMVLGIKNNFVLDKNLNIIYKSKRKKEYLMIGDTSIITINRFGLVEKKTNLGSSLNVTLMSVLDSLNFLKSHSKDAQAYNLIESEVSDNEIFDSKLVITDVTAAAATREGILLCKYSGRIDLYTSNYNQQETIDMEESEYVTEFTIDRNYDRFVVSSSNHNLYIYGGAAKIPSKQTFVAMPHNLYLDSKNDLLAYSINNKLSIESFSSYYGLRINAKKKIQSRTHSFGSKILKVFYNTNAGIALILCSDSTIVEYNYLEGRIVRDYENNDKCDGLIFFKHISVSDISRPPLTTVRDFFNILYYDELFLVTQEKLIDIRRNMQYSIDKKLNEKGTIKVIDVINKENTIVLRWLEPSKMISVEQLDMNKIIGHHIQGNEIYITDFSGKLIHIY